MEKIIKTLEELREQIRVEAEAKMDDLTRTIEILQARNVALPIPEPTLGDRVGAPTSAFKIVQPPCELRPGEVPTVRDMLIEAGEAMAEGKEELVFTFAMLREWCLAKWPDEKKKIRNAIHMAANQNVISGVWDREGQGFKIAQHAK